MPTPLAHPPPGQAGARWYRIRARPIAMRAGEKPMTAWTVADISRERARQESVFQELQHAIDYLDHAPAGFFSAEPDGRIVYLNATLAEWLGIDLTGFEAGALTLTDIVRGDALALPCRRHRARATATADHRPRPRQAQRPEPAGAPPPPRAARRRRRAGRDAHAGPQPRAPARRFGGGCGRRKCASPASSTTRRWPSPRSTGGAGSAGPTRRSCASSARSRASATTGSG